MIFEILNIRVKQLFRIIIQIGIFRAIFLLGILSLFLLYIFIILSEKTYQIYLIGVFITLLLAIQIKRKDKVFLNIYAKKPQIIFLIEYLILSIPLIIPLIYYDLWTWLFLFLLSLPLIPFLNLNIKHNSINSVFQRIIPNDNFEWKAGMRKNIILLISLWIIGLITSFYFMSVPIIIFVLGVIILNFYEKPEPLQILLAQELNTKMFLRKKIINHLIVFYSMITPLILLSVAFNPEYYYILLIEFFAFSFLLIYTILLKYAFYKPNIKSGATQIFTNIGVIGLVIPIFIPLIIILSIRFLFKASNNLNFYLNDYN